MNIRVQNNSQLKYSMQADHSPHHIKFLSSSRSGKDSSIYFLTLICHQFLCHVSYKQARQPTRCKDAAVTVLRL